MIRLAWFPVNGTTKRTNFRPVENHQISDDVLHLCPSPDLPYSLYHAKTDYYSITAYMKKTLRGDLYFLQHTSQVVALTNFSLPSFKLKN